MRIVSVQIHVNWGFNVLRGALHSHFPLSRVHYKEAGDGRAGGAGNLIGGTSRSSAMNGFTVNFPNSIWQHITPTPPRPENMHTWTCNNHSVQ